MQNENNFIRFLKTLNSLLPNIGLEIEDVSGDDNGQNHSNETLLAQKSHWKEKATKYEAEIQATKKELEELRAKNNINTNLKNNNNEKQEVDYSKLAYLNSVDVRHPDDQKAIMDEAERLKLSLTDVLNMPHMKEQLRQAKNQREVEEGMPKGDGTSGAKTKGDVDYWVNKTDKNGNYVTPQDPELASKVINARIQKESSSSMFDPIRL